MVRVLVTGATGFIGSHLVEAIRDRHEVFALVRRRPAQPLAGIHWIEQDLAHPLDYSRLPKQLDSIVHLAQSRHYRDFPDRATDIFNVNLYSTFNLLEYARAVNAQSFIFTSTGGLYGEHSSEVTEILQ
ncbi:NAD-dependent epimerase/dehydratase family protein [bacterium]|nr:NAD-dependent epimerase/dehydratase family protein [bacterium]